MLRSLKGTKEGTKELRILSSTIPRSLKKTGRETRTTAFIASTIPRSLKTAKSAAKCPRKNQTRAAGKSQMKKVARDKLFCLRCGRRPKRFQEKDRLGKLWYGKACICGLQTMVSSVDETMRLADFFLIDSKWAVVPVGTLLVMDGVEI